MATQPTTFKYRQIKQPPPEVSPNQREVTSNTQNSIFQPFERVNPTIDLVNQPPPQRHLSQILVKPLFVGKTEQRDEKSLKLVKTIQQVLLRRHADFLLKIMAQEDVTLHYGIDVDVMTLLEADPEGMDWFLLAPSFRSRAWILDSAGQEAQSQMFKAINGKKHQEGYHLKEKLHVRLGNFHALRFSGIHHTSLPSAKFQSRLISVRGTVVRAGIRRLVDTHRWFECKKCGMEFQQQAFEEEFWMVKKPRQCPGLGGPCDGTKFVEVVKEQPRRDYQECKIQENVNFLAVGRIPRSMTVLLEDDLVDSCRAGDDVIVTGVLVHRHRLPLRSGNKIDMDLSLIANHVLVKSNNGQTEGASVHDMQGHGTGMQGLDIDQLGTFPDDEFHYPAEEGEVGNVVAIEDQHKKEFIEFWAKGKDSPWHCRDYIVKSFAPRVFGMYPVKLAVLLVLMGGVPVQSQGTKIRGESHILLVGDPGTAKSQFLRSAAQVCPTRAVLTTGVGSTHAGLTCVAVKDQGEWQLEAGALVLADRGVCCIDEFASIRKSEQASVLEAMEQQTLSVAKAGIVCKLNTRCSVVAATNPKSGYDSQQSVEVNTALSAPLLSRFDLVMILLDERDEKWDKRVAGFILDGECPSRSQPLEEGWSLDLLRAYLAYCKTTFTPETTAEAGEILTRYYRLKRAGDHRDVARTTIRLLEGLIRLSQAHAKLMFRNQVLVEDAVVAVGLMESSVESGVIQPWSTSASIGLQGVRADFPDDPEAEYQELEKRVFEKLGLSRDDVPATSFGDRAFEVLQVDGTEASKDPEQDFPMMDDSPIREWNEPDYYDGMEVYLQGELHHGTKRKRDYNV